MADLISGLGGSEGFGENFLDRNDDGSTLSIDVSSVFPNGLTFFGNTYDDLYVNNNGNVTFEGSLGTFTPFGIPGSTIPIIAPFFADVDTRGGEVNPTPGGTSQGSNLAWYDLDEANGRFTVTYDDVGYFGVHTDLLNAFQLILKDASDDPGRSPGDFDIEFRYEVTEWTTGDASGGVGGLGGTPARTGYSAGNGLNFFELPQSGFQDEILILENTPGNTGEVGVGNSKCAMAWYRNSSPFRLLILSCSRATRGPPFLILVFLAVATSAVKQSWDTEQKALAPIRPTPRISSAVFFPVAP